MTSVTKQQAGFTLIEIMLVLVIIGITLTVAIPNLFSSDEQLTRQESDEAAFGGRVIAVRVDTDKLDFFERDANNRERWNPSSSPELKPHAFANGVHAQLTIAGNTVAAKDAQIAFLPVGVSLPFEIILQSSTVATSIVGDAIGNLRFKAK